MAEEVQAEKVVQEAVPAVRKTQIQQRRKASFYIKKYSLIFIGAIIAAAGLEMFLIPNEVIDGGVVGIS
ncbi:MAG: YitT family protein, partial [Selenomonadaceae bacterium]|nr:YitT family protein [Selenomonadaceae bacterium]